MNIFIPLDLVNNMYIVKTSKAEEDLDSSISADFTFSTKVDLGWNPKVRIDQNSYLERAKNAAYESLNDLDKANSFYAQVALTPLTSKSCFNLDNDSKSSGLAYSIALALEWRKQLGKHDDIAFNIIATGAVDDEGKITSIGELATKIQASVKLMSEPFIFFFPKADETPEILEQISQAKESFNKTKGIECKYIAVEYLYEALGHLPIAYDGAPEEHSLMYKGFSSFEPEDATRFFGRDALKRKLKERYDHSNNLIVAYGPSGVGKSSLIKAGLFFDVKRSEQYENLQVKISKPGSKNCIPVLLAELFEFIGGRTAGDKAIQETDVIKCLELSFKSNNKQYLWYIDQFEEIFTQIDVDVLKAKEFVEFLNSLVEKYSAMLKIVVTVRTEYKKYFSDKLLFEVTDVEPDDLEEILTKQARSLGLKFQKDSQVDLKREIKNELKGLDFPLPALQFLLKRLQKNKSPDNILLYDEYKMLEGIKGAFAKEVEKILDNEFGRSDLFFELFVGCDNDHNLYAKKVKVSHAIKTANGMKRTIDSLIEEQMVVYTTENKTEVRLIHDSLIKVNSDYRWGLFEAWYKEHKEYLDWFNSIERKYNNWLEEKTLGANDK